MEGSQENPVREIINQIQRSSKKNIPNRKYFEDVYAKPLKVTDREYFGPQHRHWPALGIGQHGRANSRRALLRIACFVSHGIHMEGCGVLRNFYTRVFEQPCACKPGEEPVSGKNHVKNIP